MKMIIAALVLVGSVAYANEPAKKAAPAHGTTPPAATATAPKMTKEDAMKACESTKADKAAHAKCMEGHGFKM